MKISSVSFIPFLPISHPRTVGRCCSIFPHSGVQVADSSPSHFPIEPTWKEEKVLHWEVEKTVFPQNKLLTFCCGVRGSRQLFKISMFFTSTKSLFTSKLFIRFPVKMTANGQLTSAQKAGDFAGGFFLCCYVCLGL